MHWKTLQRGRVNKIAFSFQPLTTAEKRFLFFIAPLPQTSGFCSLYYLKTNMNAWRWNWEAKEHALQPIWLIRWLWMVLSSLSCPPPSPWVTTKTSEAQRLAWLPCLTLTTVSLTLESCQRKNKGREEKAPFLGIDIHLCIKRDWTPWKCFWFSQIIPTTCLADDSQADFTVHGPPKGMLHSDVKRKVILELCYESGHLLLSLTRIFSPS